MFTVQRAGKRRRERRREMTGMREMRRRWKRRLPHCWPLAREAAKTDASFILPETGKKGQREKVREGSEERGSVSGKGGARG